MLHTSGPSTAELDAGIAGVKQEIAEALVDQDRYGGGLIRTQIQLRLATLQNTKAMLEQKRLSFLRGLTIGYRDTVARVELGHKAISGVNDEVAKANAEVAAANAEADQYSGGLLRVMALVRAATGRATLANLAQREVLAANGIPMPSALPDASQSASPASPPRTKISDKDALQ